MKRVIPLTVVLMLSAGLAVRAQIRKEVFGIPPPANSSLAHADPFFDDNVVHEIRLAISSRDWASLKEHYLDNGYYQCDMTWGAHTIRNIGIRSRGTGSRSGIKPGLRVDFDRYNTEQKFLGLKSFVLRNNTQDASNLHERLSMLMFRRLGLLAPREAHTKLFVNNDYVGLYTIVESIDKSFLTRNLNENDGYLYKYDYPSDAQPYRFEDKGSNPASYVPLPFKPETHESDPRPEFIVQLIQTINQGTATFRSAIAEYLDLEKFLRHVAVESFMADNDGFIGDYGVNNLYLYRYQDRKLFTFIAWDKSEAFRSPTWSIFHNIVGVSAATQNQLMLRVLQYPDLYNYYLDALLECARSAAELTSGDSRGWLEREAEREYSQIREAARSDPEKTYTNEQFEAAVEDIRSFARQRSNNVTGEVTASRVP